MAVVQGAECTPPGRTQQGEGLALPEGPVVFSDAVARPGPTWEVCMAMGVPKSWMGYDGKSD